MLQRLYKELDKHESNLNRILEVEESDSSNNLKLPDRIPHLKCNSLDKKKQYPKITNYVVTVRLGVMIELRRLSLVFPNMGKGSKFPSNISKTNGGTNLIFTTGATVTPGCETFYGAKYLAHLMRLMIECVEQPMLVVNRETGAKKKINRNLQGLTTFSGFRVVNIVSNGRLTKNYISLAEMEADDERLDWNPEYFPGLEQILTKEDVPFMQSGRAVMTIFDSGKGVGMGVRCTEDCYMAYQYVVNKALKYPDRKYVPKNSSNRFLYRQEQKRLFNLESRQKTFDWKKRNDTIGGKRANGGVSSPQEGFGSLNGDKSDSRTTPATKRTRKRKRRTKGAVITSDIPIVAASEKRRPRTELSEEGEDVETTMLNQFLFGGVTLNGNKNRYENPDDDFDRFLDQFDVT